MRSVDFLCLVPALCNHLLIMLVVSVISAAQQTLCICLLKLHLLWFEDCRL